MLSGEEGRGGKIPLLADTANNGKTYGLEIRLGMIQQNSTLNFPHVLR
jgi:hypothetical protein